MHERRSDLSRTSGKAGRMLANFFEAHVLGIMTAFSDTIENMFSVHTSEKARCIKAIEHMIKLARSNIVVALPQVCVAAFSPVLQLNPCRFEHAYNPLSSKTDFKILPSPRGSH